MPFGTRRHSVNVYDHEAAVRYGSFGLIGTTYEPGFREIQRIVLRLSDPINVLDFGCGAGRSTRFLKSLMPSAEVIGIDISDAMVNESRRIDPDGHYILSTGGIPAEDAAFDLIVSTNVLVEVPDYDNLKSIAAELFRVCRPNGIFVLMTGSFRSYRSSYRSFSYSSRNKLRNGARAECTILTPAGTIVVLDTVWSRGAIKAAFCNEGWKFCSCCYPPALEAANPDGLPVPPPFIIMSFRRPERRPDHYIRLRSQTCDDLE